MKHLYLFFLLAATIFCHTSALAASPLQPPTDDTVNPQLYLASAAPEFGTSVDELSVITLNWNFNPSAWQASIASDYAPDMYNPDKPYHKLSVTCAGKPVTAITPSISQISYTTPPSAVLTLTLDKKITADGVYSIEIPEGYVIDSGYPVPQTNGKTTLKYRIGDAEEGDSPAEEQPVRGVFHLDSTTPDVNFAVESFSFLSAQWLDSNDQPCVYDGPAELDLYTNIERQPVKAGKLKVTAGNGRIFFQLNHIADAIGKYYFTIPAGTIKSADGLESNPEDETLSVTVLYFHGSRPTDYFPYPCRTLDYKLGTSLATFAIIYDSPVNVNLSLRPYLIDPDGNVITASSWSRPAESASQGTASFSDAAILPSGRYLFFMPRNAIMGGDGIAYYVDYIAAEKPEDIEVPAGTVPEVSACTVGAYDLLDPLNGLAWLGGDAPIRISTNIDYACDAIYYKIIDITDCDSEKDFTSAPTIYSNYLYGKGSFQGSIPSSGGKSRRLSNNRLYCVEVHAYQNFNNPSFRKEWGPCFTPPFYGGCEPYQYADINVVDVSPAPGTELKTGTPLVMTFEAPVTYLYELSGIPLGKAGTLRIPGESNADGTVWTFSVPQSEYAEAGSFEIHLAFEDPVSGCKVRPSALDVPESDNKTPMRNYGSEDATSISLTYGNYDNGIEFDVEPAPGTVSSLHSFRFTHNGEEFSPSWMGEKAVVRDSNGSTVATLICDKLLEDGGNVRLDYSGSGADSYSVAVNLMLDSHVTLEGNYTLEFPYAYFTSGREKESFFSKPAVYRYYVDGSTTGVDCITDTSVLYTVYNLQGVRILSDADADALRSLQPGIYIINGEKITLK